MLDIRQEAARTIVNDLAPFEAAVDIAIARAGRLLASLTEGRLEAQVAPGMGHAAIMSTVATMNKLGEAREGVVSTRRELVFTRTRMGMEGAYIGGLPGCPPVEGTSTQVVEATAG